MYYDKLAPPPAYPVFVNPNGTPMSSPYGAPPVQSPYVVQMGPSASMVNDYLVWSILNLIFGWLFAGILPLIFSILCRNNKNANNYSSARSMSTLALIFNILATVGGLIGWIVLIVVLSSYRYYY